ncbi:MAG: hypothetical protein ACTS6A_00510 [Candidatus Hodgkinia cicadicola]
MRKPSVHWGCETSAISVNKCAQAKFDTNWRCWSIAELVRMSVQIVEEMKLVNEMLTSEPKLVTSLCVMNVSSREGHFASEETEQMNREWVIAERDWTQRLKYS